METKGKSKFIYLVLALFLLIPTILYCFKSGTMSGNSNYLNFYFSPSFMNMSGINYCSIYAFIVFLLGILAYIIHKNKPFDNTKNMFAFIIIVSAMFMIVLPFTSSDILYYFGSARMFEHFSVSPYASTLKEFILNNPVAQEDEIIAEALTNKWVYYNYPYPPLWLLITSLITRLSFGSLDTCFLLIKMLVAGIHVLNTWLIHKTFKDDGFTLLYGLNPAMLVSGVADLHGEMFVVFFIVLSLFFLIEKKNILLAIIALGLSAAIKFVAILALPFILLYHFQSFSPGKRFGKCVIYGFIFIGVILITMLPFMDISQLVGLMSNQQTYVSHGFYSILVKLFGSNIGIVQKIIFITFVLSYIALCFYFLFKKTITKEQMLNTSLAVMCVFITFIITNFRCWYILWAIPFSKEHKEIVAGWSILTLLILFFSMDADIIYSWMYFASVILIAIFFGLKRILLKIKENKCKKGES